MTCKIKVMNAKQARAKAEAANHDAYNIQLASVSEQISKKAEKGEFELNLFSQTLLESVHNELTRLGFVIVKQPAGPNETDTLILW